MAKKTKGKKDDFISFRVTEDIKRQLLIVAEKRDRSLSYLVNQIIVEYLENSTEK